MGATKLLSEKIITNAPIGQSHVKFCCVRFGNVLNSAGSVVPIFKKQIEDGKSITITSKEMTRFCMSIHDAVRLVLKAAQMVKGGETFIFKMNALKIVDLAEVLVEELAPKKNIKFEIIGIRPGEKLSEALVSCEESAYTEETDDMIILKNSLLAYESYGLARINEKFNHLHYDSDKVKLLTKAQIKEILKRDNII